MNDPVAEMLADQPQLYVKQRKELVEILVDWETANRYVVLGANDQQIGYVAERKGGLWSFFRRGFFRSHRALEIDIFDAARRPLMHLSRAFFFLFSDLELVDRDGRSLGSIHRRFGILYKRYDLHDETGQVFARVESPLWRLWQFPIARADGSPAGQISKRWSGMLREVFTDSDQYQVDFGGQSWSPAQRAVILGAAISIDFDFFENNEAAQGGLLGMLRSKPDGRSD